MEDQGPMFCTMCVTPGTPTMPNMAFRLHCDLSSLLATIRSLKSLHVTYFDYMSPTVTTSEPHTSLKCMRAPMTHLGTLRKFVALTRGEDMY